MISTVSGGAQLSLIEAAAAAEVRLFIPSSFSGPRQSSPLLSPDADFVSALNLLASQQGRTSMRHTIITCGIFFERFGPGGLSASEISRSGNPNEGIGHEGDFLVDIREGTAMVPFRTADQPEKYICVTGARDVARYIVAALQRKPDISKWPAEFKFFTERISITELLEMCARARGELLSMILPSQQLRHLRLATYQACRKGHYMKQSPPASESWLHWSV